MKVLIPLILSIFCVFTVDAHPGAKPADPNAKTFGGTIGQTAPVPLADVLANYEKYKTKPAVFTATANKVCEKVGCWMVLQDGTSEVRTMFKDYGFNVPKNILNKKVRVQGIVEKKTVSVAAQKHYLKDADASESEMAKITTPKTEFQIVADAVEVL